MKKTFKLNAPNKQPARQIDAIKHEIKKYIGRERRKTIPDSYDRWEFDCCIGADEENAEVVAIEDIGKNIDLIASKGHDSFYLQILSRPGYRPKKAE